MIPWLRDTHRIDNADQGNGVGRLVFVRSCVALHIEEVGKARHAISG
jgi:hypothetical protein